MGRGIVVIAALALGVAWLYESTGSSASAARPEASLPVPTRFDATRDANADGAVRRAALGVSAIAVVAQPRARAGAAPLRFDHVHAPARAHVVSDLPLAALLAMSGVALVTTQLLRQRRAR